MYLSQVVLKKKRFLPFSYVCISMVQPGEDLFLIMGQLFEQEGHEAPNRSPE